MADYKVPVITGSELSTGDILRWDGSDWVNYPDSSYVGGSGTTLIVFTPQCAEVPPNNFATLDIRNVHPVLDFDDTTAEYVRFSGVMPRHYTGGGVTVYLHYAMTTATTDTVDWGVNWERIGDQQLDIDSDNWAGSNMVTNTTVPGTAGLVDIVSIAFTDGADMASVAAGEGFTIYVFRNATQDDATGDAELLFVEIKET